MRIVLVTPEFRPKIGGMARSAERLAASFVRAGHTTTILTYDRCTDLLAAPYVRRESLGHAGPAVLRIGPYAAKHAGADVQTKAMLRRQFVEHSVGCLRGQPETDIVLSFGLIDAGFPGLCVAQALGVPHIVSARGADMSREAFEPEKFPIAQWVISRSASAVFVNRYLHDLGVAVFGSHDHFHVISNGVEDPGEPGAPGLRDMRKTARDRLRIPPEATVIGWVGTFRAKKGLTYLDRAVRLLLERGRDVYLLIVGGPRNENERSLCSLLDDSGQAGNRVRCIGLLPDPNDVCEYYAAMDVFAYPSIDDGHANALLEAMAFALPVIATEIFNDVALTEATALLVPRFDAIAVADALERVAGDPVLAENLGRRARGHVLHNFSAQRECTEYLALIQEACRNEPLGICGSSFSRY